MSIIRGPIFISAVSLPVAIFAFCLRGILRGIIFDFRGIFCLRGTRRVPVAGLVVCGHPVPPSLQRDEGLC
jgi:hypothetical protein